MFMKKLYVHAYTKVIQNSEKLTAYVSLISVLYNSLSELAVFFLYSPLSLHI